MKALLYTEAGRENGKVTDIPYPECMDDQVIVKVMCCGICIGVEQGHDTTGTSLSKYPVVPGHEFSGIVHEVPAITARKINPSTAGTLDRSDITSMAAWPSMLW